MMKPPEMARVHAIGSKKVLPRVSEKLYELRKLHIVDFKEDEFFERGTSIEGASDVSERLIRVRSVIDGLGIEEIPSSSLTREEVESALEEKLPRLLDELSGLLSKQEDIRDEFSEKYELLGRVEPFAELPLNFEHYHGYESLEVFVGLVREEPELRELRKEEHYTAQVNGKQLIALFVSEEEALEAEGILSEAAFEPFQVPLEEGNPEEVSEELSREAEELKSDLSDVEEKLLSLKEQEGALLLAVEEYLSMDSEKKELPLRIAESKNTFVVDGWIPITAVEEVEGALASMDERIHFEVVEKVEEEEAEELEGEEEEPPVAYQNPGPVKPFETFTDMFGRPNYHEIDPTTFVFAAFPFIYGMVLGDVVYGLGSLLLGLFLKKKTGAAKNLGYAFILAGLSSMIFGVAYAEALGPEALGIVWAEDVNHLLGTHALPLLERNLFVEHVQIPLLLMLTIWIGIIQVGGGFLFDFYNELSAGHGLKHAVPHSFSWFMLLVGILGALTSSYDILLMPSFPAVALYPFLGLALVSAVMIALTEGMIGIFEIPSRIFSHTFSYSRIAAVGLSSVAIALVINRLAEMMIFEQGGILIVLGIFTYVFGHLFNLVLGIFSSTLHSIRLQWVEFFTKFFEGGGKKFRPFGRITKYLEEI